MGIKPNRAGPVRSDLMYLGARLGFLITRGQGSPPLTQTLTPRRLGTARSDAPGALSRQALPLEARAPRSQRRRRPRGHGRQPLAGSIGDDQGYRQGCSASRLLHAAGLCRCSLIGQISSLPLSIRLIP
jgi:hypothetical protein